MQTQSVVEAVRNISATAARKWLIVGKGPSSNYLNQVALDGHFVFTLNHACEVVVPHIAHFVDMEAFEANLERLKQLNCLVCLPWHPHVQFKPGTKTLLEYPKVVELGARVVSYNSTTGCARVKHPKLPTIRLRYFSAVAAFNILTAAGLKAIYSIGVDGGTAYGKAFKTNTCLANGQKTFDVQTKEIERTLRKAKGTWVRLPIAEKRGNVQKRKTNPTNRRRL